MAGQEGRHGRNRRAAPRGRRAPLRARLQRQREDHAVEPPLRHPHTHQWRDPAPRENLASLAPSRRDQFRADHIGVVFQQFDLLPYLTVLENVTLSCSFSSRKQRRAGEVVTIKESARQLSGDLNLTSDLHGASVNRLSVGRTTASSGRTSAHRWTRDPHRRRADLHARRRQSRPVHGVAVPRNRGSGAHWCS